MISKEIATVLALRVYEQGVRELRNLPLEPQGWIKIVPNPLPETDGFAYGVFRNTATNEIVISYRGTDGIGGMMGADGINNAGLALGQATSQAIQAAKVYAKVLELYGTNAEGSNISFTGHSLGGGLAGVMAVWFNRPAIVFDPAPFQLTAQSVLAVGSAVQSLGATAPQALRTLFTSLDTDQSAGFAMVAAREMAVASHYAIGEFLQFGRFESTTVYGTNTPYTFGNQNGDVNMFAMHSHALLTAGILSPGFVQATVAVQRSLPLIMSGSFYSKEPDGSTERNFLLDPIRSEQQSPNASKLDNFAADLNKLGTDIAGLNQAAKDAITAQGIEWYYHHNSYTGQQFITVTNSVLQYTVANAAGFGVTANKASAWAVKWTTPLLNAEGQFGGAFAVNYDQWNVSGSAGGSASARDVNKSQVFIGNSGADTFTGGNKADTFLAGTGEDTLNGGIGNDVLYGGQGNDTYQFTGAWGTDTILDSDGLGSIQVDGVKLNGGQRVSANAWQSADEQWRYALTETGELIITSASKPGRIIVKDWSRMLQATSTPLGLSLEQASAPQPPAPTPEPGMYALQGGYFVPGGPQLPAGAWQIQSDGSIPGAVPLQDSNDLMVGGQDALRAPGAFERISGVALDSEGNPYFTRANTRAVSFWGLGGNDFYMVKVNDLPRYSSTALAKTSIDTQGNNTLQFNTLQAGVWSYKFRSCLRPYLLGKSLIRYRKKACHARNICPCALHTSSLRGSKNTINSIAACADKQGTRRIFDSKNQRQSRQSRQSRQNQSCLPGEACA